MEKEIHYKGKGEHSVRELETIVEQQKEKLYQLQIDKQSALQKQIEMTEGEVEDTTEKFYIKDNRTGEVEYTGNRRCRACSKRKDSLSIDDILSILNQYK